MIVTEISKEDENNNITRLNAYSKYYVHRRPRVGEVGRSAGPGDGGVGGSHSGGGSSGRFDAVREYTFISVEIKSVSETFIS